MAALDTSQVIGRTKQSVQSLPNTMRIQLGAPQIFAQGRNLTKE
ncbi:MAG: hypothetical protein NVSMB27_47550 [Ktedonobacteraceae bacterium]